MIFSRCDLKFIVRFLASCMEKAYEDIDVEECRKMLHLEKGELDKFLSDRNWSVDKRSKKIQFLSQEKKPSQEMEVPSRELAAMAISYAKEMEKIVWVFKLLHLINKSSM